MKRIAFLALLIGISTFFVFAQKGKVTVSGSVFDKEDNSPVMQATVQLLALPDSSMVAGGVTDGIGIPLRPVVANPAAVVKHVHDTFVFDKTVVYERHARLCKLARKRTLATLQRGKMCLGSC